MECWEVGRQRGEWGGVEQEKRDDGRRGSLVLVRLIVVRL